MNRENPFLTDLLLSFSLWAVTTTGALSLDLKHDEYCSVSVADRRVKWRTDTSTPHLWPCNFGQRWPKQGENWFLFRVVRVVVFNLSFVRWKTRLVAFILVLKIGFVWYWFWFFCYFFDRIAYSTSFSLFFFFFNIYLLKENVDNAFFVTNKKDFILKMKKM